MGPMRPLTGNHFGSFENRALFRLKINEAGRFTLYVQAEGRTFRHAGVASDQFFVLQNSAGVSLELRVKLEEDPVLRPRLAVRVGDSIKDITLFNRFELKHLAADRAHVLLSCSADAADEGGAVDLAHACSFAVMLRQAGGLVAIAGRDFRAKPWSTWSFVPPTTLVPVLTRDFDGALKATAQGSVEGKLRWREYPDWIIHAEGSAFSPPSADVNVFGASSTPLSARDLNEPTATCAGSGDARGSIRLHGQPGTDGRLQANSKTGMLKGSLRLRSGQPTARATGIYIPHRRAFVGHYGRSDFEITEN
jgi:hypothetical protein